MSRTGLHTNAWTSTATTKRKRAFIAAAGGICSLCGDDRQIEVDHRIPLSMGGDLLDETNWSVLCKPCHRRKTNAENRRPSEEGAKARTGGGTQLPGVSRTAPKLRQSRAVKVVVGPERDESGMVLPRLLSVAHPDAVGSHGPLFAEWCRVRLGWSMRPWQTFVADRLMEHDADGRLVWPEAVITLSRQQGKSYLLRALALFRMEHPDLFGDGSPQVVLHVANRRLTAREVWMHGARLAERTLDAVARYSNGQEEVETPNGSRWLVQAGNENAGIGYTIDLAVVDEAWNVPRPVVDDAIAPTMVERIDSQLLLISTAGDSNSDLLQSRRDAAIEAIHSGVPGSVLLIEWSVPEDMPLSDPSGWEWASPHWHPRRAAFIAQQFGKVPEESFARQFANRWVVAVDGWVDAGVWESCRKPTITEPDAPPAVAACEVSVQGQQHAVVLVWPEPTTGGFIVRLRQMRTVQDVDDLLRALRPVQVLMSPYYEDRLTVTGTVVGRQELTVATPITHDLIQRGLVLHDGDPMLARQMLQARASRTDAGWIVSATRSAGPIHAVRAMCWALSASSRGRGGRPRFVAR